LKEENKLFSAYASTPSLVKRSVSRLCQPAQSEMPTIQLAVVGLPYQQEKRITSTYPATHPQLILNAMLQKIQKIFSSPRASYPGSL